MVVVVAVGSSSGSGIVSKAEAAVEGKREQDVSARAADVDLVVLREVRGREKGLGKY